MVKPLTDYRIFDGERVYIACGAPIRITAVNGKPAWLGVRCKLLPGHEGAHSGGHIGGSSQ